MPWSYKFHPGAAKDLFKLAKKNKPLGRLIADIHIAQIVADPYGAGRKKEGILSHVYGFNFNFQGVNYRILYAIYRDFVRFLAFGVHDVAYRKAEGRL